MQIDTNIINISRKNKILYILFFLFVSFLILTICSNNSFLYAKFTSCDQNWYITMGNGFIHGKIPYRDMYEQKGPIIYFLYAIVVLIAGNVRNAYYVAFFLEIIILTAYMYLAYKFLNKFLNKYVSIILAIISAIIIADSIYLCGGGGAIEEYISPVIMWFVLIGYENIKGKPLSKKQSLLVGLFLGLIFWSKYVCAIPIFAVFVVWFIYKMIKKEFKETFTSIGYMMISFFALTLFILMFFLCFGALNDLFQCYFYDNLFRYNDMIAISNSTLYFTYAYAPVEYLIILSLFILTAFFAVKDKNILYLCMLYVFITALSKVGKLNYYYLPLTFLTPLLIIAFVQLFNCIKEKFNFEPLKLPNKLFKFINISLIVVLIVVSSFALCVTNINSYVSIKDENITAQSVVAQTIRSYNLSSPTLLTFEMLDYGYYNATNIIPTEKFYARNNFSRESYPELYESMEIAVREAHTDFVLTENGRYETSPELFDEHYTLIKTYQNVQLFIKTSLLTT